MVLLKKDFAERVLNGGEVEDRLGQDQVEILGTNLEDVAAKDIVPELSLSVPIDQVALLEGKEVEQAREVLAVLQLGPNEAATAFRL